MTAQLEHIILQLEKLTPEEQTMMAEQIQELIEDAEDIASADEVLNDPNNEWLPFEEVVSEMKRDGLL